MIAAPDALPGRMETVELSRQLTWSAQQAELSHYRDQSRYEVDAVLENRAGRVVGIVRRKIRWRLLMTSGTVISTPMR